MQKENAAVSVYTSLMVLERFCNRNDIAALVPEVKRSLREIRIPGRFERYSVKGLPVIIDGAHTVYSLKNFTTVIREMYRPPRSCVFGMVEGKDIHGSIRYILDTFDTICITTPGTFKKSNTDEIFCSFREAADSSHTIILEKEPETALDRVLAADQKVLCVAGSFYLAGIIKKLCNERGYAHA